MFGCDSAVHVGFPHHVQARKANQTLQMAEEVRNAEVVVPWSMITTTLFNGAFGWAMVIAVLFVTTDITGALSSQSGTLGFPILQIFYDALGSKAGASVLAAILLVMTLAGTISSLATASRLVWAFARDRGLPGWRYWSKVHAKKAIPMLAVIVASSIACVIGLISIGSATAFNDVISLSVSSLYASYIITESLLLWRRCTGAIRSPNDTSHIDSGEANQLIWGPFHLPGIFGIIVNVFSVAFAMIIFFFSFWPVATPVVAATMNFSVLMTGSVVLFAVVYYIIVARHTYIGPIVEVTPYSTNGAGTVVAGTVVSDKPGAGL